MPSTPKDGSRAIAAHLGLTAAGGGSAGTVIALLTVHKPAAILLPAAFIGAGAIAAALAQIVESVCSRRAAVLTAKGKAQVEIIDATARKEALLITAVSEANALARRTLAYAAVIETGLDPQRATQASEMLEHMTLNIDLPEHKRPGDDAVKEILTILRPHPGGPTRGPKSRSSDVVVDLRRRRSQLIPD